MHRAHATILIAAAILAAPACALAAGGGGSGDINPGDLGQAAAALIIFGLLLFVLGKWAWKPIIAQLQHREESIAAAVQRAEKREIKAQTLLSDYQARLEQVEIESRELLEQSRKEAAAAREALLSQARKEAAEAAVAHEESLARAKREVIQDLYDQTADLAADIAGRVLRRELSPQEHQRLVEESLQQIGQETRSDE
ncbi:MAG: hypothetical protein ACLFV7_13935 [Phycisphaerae bacterium]